MANCSLCKRDTPGGYKHKTSYECYLKAEEQISQMEDRITELETELAEACNEIGTLKAALDEGKGVL